MKKIIITKRNGDRFTILVSNEDYDFLEQWRWHLAGGNYARRYTKARQSIYMHRVVLERKLGKPVSNNFEVDHIDRNTLNNTRENLRAVTRRENCLNQDRYDCFEHAKRFKRTGVRF